MPTSQSSKATIARAQKNEWGYSVSQVDEFLKDARERYEAAEPDMTQDEIHRASFDLEKNGYDVAAVDAALRRLEDAVVDKLADWTIRTEGVEAWRTQNEQLALTLIPRAKRADKEIFHNGKFLHPSYDKAQVDLFVRKVANLLNEKLELGVFSRSHRQGRDEFHEYSREEVANVVFTQRSGASGYDEAQVDAYINRVVEILTRIEATNNVLTTANSANDLMLNTNVMPEVPVFADLSVDEMMKEDQNYHVSQNSEDAPTTNLFDFNSTATSLMEPVADALTDTAIESAEVGSSEVTAEETTADSQLETSQFAQSYGSRESADSSDFASPTDDDNFIPPLSFEPGIQSVPNSQEAGSNGDNQDTAENGGNFEDTDSAHTTPANLSSLLSSSAENENN